MAFVRKAGVIKGNISQCNTNFSRTTTLDQLEIINMVPENDKRDRNSQVTINTTSKTWRQLLLENENNDQTSLGTNLLTKDSLISTRKR